MISEIKNINVYKKKYNEEIWSKNKISQSRIKEVMKKILLKDQINDFFLKRVSVITICATRLSNSISNSFKTWEKNEIFVVKRFLFKSIMTLLISQLLTFRILVVIQHFYWNSQSLARLRNAKKSSIKRVKRISETLLNWSFRQWLWKKVNHQQCQKIMISNADLHLEEDESFKKDHLNFSTQRRSSEYRRSLFTTDTSKFESWFIRFSDMFDSTLKNAEQI